LNSVLDDLDGRRTGERIQTIRERKGMSRPTVAGLVGRSSEWLKGIERGTRLPPRLPTLVRLAEVLGVGDVTVLVGTDLDVPRNVSLPITSFRRIPHEAVPAIREAIQAALLTIDGRLVDVAALRARVDHAWRLWHSSPTQRTDVGRVLPALITDARLAARTAEGEERRDANAALADVYGLCEQMLAWTSEPELLWMVADRGISAAQEADRPTTLAGAAWVLGNVRRAVSDFDGAVGVIEDARAILEPRLEDADDDLRGMWGALHLHAAITCARAGRSGDAWRYWDAGNAAVSRLPDGYHHPWTQFGSSNVAVHAVSIGVDLTNSNEARRRAETVDPDTVPSLERRSRLEIEIARSYHQRRDYSTVEEWVERAHRTSSESVRFSPIARQMVSDIVDHGGALVERRARSFGQLLGLPV
jgi:transcriptional regulator with XRE-family HTH domain